MVRAFAERLEQLGPRYNALALPLPEQAIRAAKDVDKEIKRGRMRGPLQGIPYGAKDLLSFAGQITTWGAKPYAAQVFDYNATVIDKLDSAGAVLTGKLSMVELAGGGGYRFPPRRSSARAQPVGPHALVGRIVERFGDCRGGGPGAIRSRLGDIRLDRDARVILRRHRIAPHLWTGEPPRRDGALLDAR